MEQVDRVVVRVPATSANLGPGFDALGLALDLAEDVVLERLALASPSRVSVTGVNSATLVADENLLAWRGVRAVYDRLARPVPPLALELRTRIPRSGGLGGSAAAIVAGVTAANAIEGKPLSRREELEIAAAIEGHPDNVAAALYGGLVISVVGRDGLVTSRLAIDPALRAVVCLPETSLSTKTARGVIPREFSIGDAVFNLGRTALLVAAFATGEWDLLRDAMDDRVHQPARGTLLPLLYPVIAAAIGAGAHGAALSGAGSAMIALATDHFDEIGVAMVEAAHLHQTPCRAVVIGLSNDGARVI